MDTATFDQRCHEARRQGAARGGRRVNDLTELANRMEVAPMPWKETPEAEMEHQLIRRRRKLIRQYVKDPDLLRRLKVRADAGDTIAASKLRTLLTPHGWVARQ